MCLSPVSRVFFCWDPPSCPAAVLGGKLIYHFMNCFIQEGGVKFGNQIYAKMDCDGTVRGFETRGDSHNPTSSLEKLRLSVHFDHLKLSQLSLQVFLRNHFDAFKFS